MQGGMCIGVPDTGRHRSHKSGRIHLRSGARHAHVPDKSMWHPSRRDTGLARVVGHAGGHMRRRVLLHRARMRRKVRRNNASHHPPRVSNIHRVDIDLSPTALSHARPNQGSSVVVDARTGMRSWWGPRAKGETRVC